MTDRPLRIAMISYYLPSTSKQGVGHQVHALATALVQRGHTVDVFSDCPPVDGAVYGHRHVKMRGSLRTFRFALALRKTDFSAYDVLHAHGDDYWMWRRRVPRHVRTLHGSCFEEALRISGLKERARMLMLGFTEVLASLVADTTVTVSPGTRRWTPWVKGVIPNGVNLTQFHPRPEGRTPHPTVLFVGTWKGRKRGSHLATAFQAEVLPQFPSAELLMVTRDAPPDPGPGVRVLGRLTDQELAGVYAQSWVFCLPSTYEGFGIPYVEAMASGTPVVATPNVGARFVTHEGRDGVLSSMEHLGTSLREMLEDEAQRERYRTRGRMRAEDFSLNSVAERYEALYRDT